MVALRSFFHFQAHQFSKRPYIFIDGLVPFVGLISVRCMPYCRLIVILSSSESIHHEPSWLLSYSFLAMVEWCHLPNRGSMRFFRCILRWSHVIRGFQALLTFYCSTWSERAACTLLSNLLFESDTGNFSFKRSTWILKISCSNLSLIGVHPVYTVLANWNPTILKDACLVARTSLERRMYIRYIPSWHRRYTSGIVQSSNLSVLCAASILAKLSNQKSLLLSCLGHSPTACREEISHEGWELQFLAAVLAATMNCPKIFVHVSSVQHAISLQSTWESYWLYCSIIETSS